MHEIDTVAIDRCDEERHAEYIIQGQVGWSQRSRFDTRGTEIIMIAIIKRLWDHLEWSDRRLLEALSNPPAVATAVENGRVDGERPHSDILREYAHIIGAEETWLSRLEVRASRMPVWPEVTMEELKPLVEQTHESYRAYLAGLSDEKLSRFVHYVNSAGREFTNRVGDILLHVALHGQYHRGKVNLMLRLQGADPAPTDYIAFMRNAPAATAADLT